MILYDLFITTIVFIYQIKLFSNGQAYLRRSPRIGSRICLSQPLCVLIVGVWAAILLIGLIGKIGITERENEAMDISRRSIH